MYSTSSYKIKDLSGINLGWGTLASWNFSGQNLTSASFYNSTLTGADFTNAKITSADFRYTGFTKEQLYSTASYANKDLHGVKLGNNDLSGWDFSGQNLQNANFEYAYFKDIILDGADLRGANLAGIYGKYTAPKNILSTDGKIQNFSMTSSADNFSIRKYTPATTAVGKKISAKFAEDASVSGGAMLTLEQGAEVEVVDNATLSFGADSSLLINTDKDGSTTFSVESGAGLIFANGAKLTVNIIDADSVLNVDGYKFVVMNWNDDSRMTGLDDFVIDSTLFLTLNGTSYDKAWSYYIKDNQMFIEAGQVPEPATYAAIFGALALAFAAYRRRK